MSQIETIEVMTANDAELTWLKTEPMFKTLHGNPRYEELLRKIGFPE
jgi:hypothetical protein